LLLLVVLVLQMLVLQLVQAVAVAEVVNPLLQVVVVQVLT
jgi:hypothetical protein